ncbi:MAG: hypothetical protein KDD45_04705, partial [Bdellovibrionales bacterium]|nr:hypothetical protein [Bdellovibrionales bacterium]
YQGKDSRVIDYLFVSDKTVKPRTPAQIAFILKRSDIKLGKNISISYRNNEERLNIEIPKELIWN